MLQWEYKRPAHKWAGRTPAPSRANFNRPKENKMFTNRLFYQLNTKEGETKIKGSQCNSKNRGGRKMFHSLIAAIVIAASLWVTPAVHADEGPEITREVRHAFSTVQHFDPIPECGFPGATEYATGNDHFIIVDMGDSVHVTFMETFRVLEVPDDPAFPTIERKGTDTLHFNLTKGGTETFSESYHEFASRENANNFWKIGYFRTFVSTGDKIRVDREFARNPPSCYY